MDEQDLGARQPAHSGERPRIVILDAAMGFTGAFKATVNIARSAAPWADTVLVLPVGSQIGHEHLGHFSEVAYLPVRQIRRSLGDLLLYLPSLLAGSWRVRKLLRRSGKGGARLVMNDFFLMHGAMLRIFGYKGPLLTWVRMDPARFPRLLSRLWLWAALRGSDHVVAVSKFIAGRLPASPKVRLLYDPVDQSLPALASSHRARRDIVCVANYIEGKGQDHAIAAFARIAADHPDTNLLFFGGDMGMEKNKRFRRGLEVQADALGLKHRIKFNGFVDRVEEAFASAAVALNLSESESFSLTCLEASSLGLPVIAFRSGGPEEIIVNGETGFLFNRGDVDGVASALRRLLGVPELASRIGRAGSVRVSEQFSGHRFQQDLKAMLRL